MSVLKEIEEPLLEWNDISKKVDWAAILLGNGLSRNLWEPFGYSSLFDGAQSEEITHRLAQEDLELFESLATKNFESTLSSLGITKTVLTALNKQTDFLEERYESIRLALVDAVHHMHCSWKSFTNDKKTAISDSLSNFEFVYSTNYDLTVYWSIMHNPNAFKDYFWAKEFDLGNTEIWGKCTKVLYLHGGLHLYRKPTGLTVKRTAMPWENLLDLFGKPFGGALPLFVSEGSSDEKKASIYRSDYLSFAFSQFANDTSPIVVFGHSLSDVDDHLVQALKAHRGRQIAFSVRPENEKVKTRKAEIIAKLPHAELYFFDAKTHPLGNPKLRIAP